LCAWSAESQLGNASFDATMMKSTSTHTTASTRPQLLLLVPRWIGNGLIHLWKHSGAITAMSLTLIYYALQPGSWKRTVRAEFIRQCYFSGVRAVQFIIAIAVLTGLGMVAQIIYWLSLAGQSDLVGSALAVLLVREFAPLLIILIVVGRSGTAIVAEVGNMQVNGRIYLLRTLGVDPLIYIFMPRALAISISTLALTVLFVVIALFTGFVTVNILGMFEMTLQVFIDRISAELGPGDYLAIAIKTMVGGLVTSLICCRAGLLMSRTDIEVARALPRSFSACVLAALAISAVVSIFLR
jgi:phospholipid/cholesterol/gamma-HCH transport system permease protein